MEAGHPALAAAAVALGLAATGVPASQEDPAAGYDEVGRYGTPADSEATAAVLRDIRVRISGPPVSEPFVYPLDGRRNPFHPPAAAGATGARFSGLTLAGIIYAPRSGSVVVLSDSATGRRYRLRVGDRLGEIRLVEVKAQRAIFRVRPGDTTERPVFRVLRLGRSGQR